MEYTKIDKPEEVAQQGLAQTARELEEKAFASEMALEEAKAQSKVDSNIQVTGLKDAAGVARHEADAYVKASGMSEDAVNDVHVTFTHRLIESIERNHIYHSALLEVKAGLGEATSSYNDILAKLDASHEVATAKLDELTGEKRAPTGPRRKRIAPKSN